MKQKWLELTWPQRVMLLLQGFLILLFLILYCTIGRQQVIWYGSSPLRYRTDGKITTYSGKVDGQKAVFTVSPGPVVEYRLGDTLYGPYSITYDPSAVPNEENIPMYISSTQDLVGVEVREGLDVLFRGAYLDTSYTFLVFDENGDSPFYSNTMELVEIAPDSGVYGPVSDSTPSISSILQVALAPEIVQRCYFGAFWLGLFCCVICVLTILYADALFRFHLQFRIRNAEDAEPTDWELFGRWVSWISLTIMALAIFIIGINAH